MGHACHQVIFPTLKVRLTADKEDRAVLLRVVFHLHNFRKTTVGINQIKTVYLEHWQQSRRDKLRVARQNSN